MAGDRMAHESAHREHVSVVIGDLAYSRVVKHFFFVIVEFGMAVVLRIVCSRSFHSNIAFVVSQKSQHSHGLKWEVAASLGLTRKTKALPPKYKV